MLCCVARLYTRFAAAGNDDPVDDDAKLRSVSSITPYCNPKQLTRRRTEDLKAQGEAATRTIERLRKKLEEHRKSLLDLKASYKHKDVTDRCR